MSANQKATNIKVVCRLRPLNTLEKSIGGECAVDYTDTSIQVKIENDDTKHEYSFDRIFGPDSKQVDVFNYVALPTLDGVVDGFNGTIFAYGQTGSGKSFTMEGPSLENEEMKGIIPRMMGYVFNKIINAEEHIEFSVKVSYLEIYNEKIQDLLDARKSNLQIKEDKIKGIFVQDATEVYVSSSEQMMQVMKTGAENRSVAATRMNENSSRSHSIFVLHLIQRDTKTETTKTGKLYFVDLAGSERLGKTMITAKEQKDEAKSINKSLTCLGRVIHALTEKEKGFVPYRESKLTRILQESLGGNSHTTLVLACSMCSYNAKETLETLRFGNRAKAIKNAVVANVELSTKELKAMLEAAEKKIKYQEEIISSFQKDGTATPRTSVAVSNTIEKVNEEQKMDKSDSSQDSPAVIRKDSKPKQTLSLLMFKQQVQVNELREQIEELKYKNQELETEINAKNQEIYELNGRILSLEAERNETSNSQLNYLQEFQVKFEKLCEESQNKTNLINKLRRDLSRLRSDLSFLQFNKNMAFVHNSTPKKDEDGLGDEYMISAIQKSLCDIEEIEKEFSGSGKESTIQKEIETMIEIFMKSPRKSSVNAEIKSATTPSSIDRDSRPRSRFYNEHLSTAADEEAKQTQQTQTTEESTDRNENIGDIRTDREIIDNEIIQKMVDSGLSAEEKLMEFHSLLINQRKTIIYLSKLNEELSQSQNIDATKIEEKMLKYKKKLKEIQHTHQDKLKEAEKKIEAMKTLLETKIAEQKEVENSLKKEIIHKSQLVNDLRFHNEHLQKLIVGNSNSNTKRVYELEQKIKEYGPERQRLFEELFKLRQEVDDKDELISGKNTQIHLLQNNLMALSNQLEALKYLKKDNEQPGISRNNSKEQTKVDKNKNDLVFFDKRVINPIKGGGGKIENYERNNFTAVAQAEANKDKVDPYKRFDEIAKSRTELEDNDSEEEEEDDCNDSEEEDSDEQEIVQQKLKAIQQEPVNTARKIFGSFFH